MFKNAITITLLLVHSFNIAGYQLFFTWLQQKASNEVVQRLDRNDYTDAELIEIKIAYPLPYATNWKEYERINGEIEFNGVHYNYVKRKLSNDTIYLMCIPNRVKTNLSAAKNEFAQTGDEVNPGSGEKKADSPGNLALKKSFGTEYNNLIAEFSLVNPKIAAGFQFASYDASLLENTKAALFQPPRI